MTTPEIVNIFEHESTVSFFPNKLYFINYELFYDSLRICDSMYKYLFLSCYIGVMSCFTFFAMFLPQFYTVFNIL